MTALDPIMYMAHIVEYDRFGQPEELHGHCAWEQSLPYVVTLVVVNMIALILALIEAWKARNLATEFAESECIGKALFLILMVVIIGGKSKCKLTESFFFFVCSNVRILMTPINALRSSHPYPLRQQLERYAVRVQCHSFCHGK